MNEYSIERIPYHEARPWIMKKHYAKRDVTATDCFGLYFDGILQGVCVFGSVIPNVAASYCGESYAPIVRELTRLVVNEGLEENALSFFVARCLKQLKKPCIVVAYSDTHYGHHGYIYQALNFIYTGIGSGTKASEFIINGKSFSSRPLSLRLQLKLQGIYDPNLTRKENVKKLGGYITPPTQGKHRYFHFLGSKKQRAAMLKALRFGICPYPKGENKRYEIKEKTITQLVL